MPIFVSCNKFDKEIIGSPNRPKVLINEYTLSKFANEIEELSKYFLNEESSSNFNTDQGLAEQHFSKFLDKFKIAYDKCFLRASNHSFS